MSRIEFADAGTTVWSCGWNIPGYMPDTEPACFTTWEEARNCLDYELELGADDFTHVDGTQEIVDQFAAARQLLEQAEPDQPFCERVGNYVWWVERVVLPKPIGY